MVKKIHHKIVHHGIRQGLPFGGGFGVGSYFIIDSVKEAISSMTHDTTTLQQCIDIVQSALP